MYSEVLTFMVAAAALDDEAIERVELSSADAEFKGGVLYFTLPGLYQLLAIEGLEYLPFRQQIYASELNTQLAGYGCRVDVYRSSEKVDSSCYRLVTIDDGAAGEF